MQQKILTLHPEGKQGVNISQSKYDTIRAAIVASLEQVNGMPFGQLATSVSQNLADPFDGSIGWYTTCVKLDLEARSVIECDRRRSPQLLYLNPAS